MPNRTFPHMDTAAKLLSLTASQEIQDLVNWLEAVRTGQERIEVGYWTMTAFQITIVDKSKLDPNVTPAYVSTMMCGFGVDVSTGTILWENNQAGLRYAFVRSPRWYRLLKLKYPQISFTKQYTNNGPADGMVRDYRRFKKAVA